MVNILLVIIDPSYYVNDKTNSLGDFATKTWQRTKDLVWNPIS